MSFTAGRVQVPVVPDLRGFQKTVGKSATGVGQQWSQNFGRETESRMKRIGGFASTSLKRGLKVTGVGATIAAGLTIKGGMTRLLGIEDARASLAGLGHDAKSIDKIMGNALKSVKGTAFGMADAGKVAASAVAAGVKPGKELERTLKLVGDGATIAKVSFGEMGSIFGKVAASNKIQGDVIAQLNDQGIPIVQLLSKELGKSSEETIKLASQGKVNFETFQKAMEEGLGGAALKSGDTMRGAFANTQAAIGRVGANLLTGIFPEIRGGFQGLTKSLSPLEDKATVVGEKIGVFAKDAIRRLKRVKKSLGGFTLDTDKFDGEAFGTKLAAGIGSGVKSLGKLAKTLGQRIGELAGKVDWVGVGIEFGKAAVPLVTGLALGILNVDLAKLLGSLGDHWRPVLIGLLTVAFAPTKLLAPIGRIVSKIPFLGPLTVWLAKGFRGATQSVVKFIGGLFGNMWKGFKFQLGWLGPNLASRVLGVLRGMFPRLKEWGGSLAIRVGDSFRFAFFQGGRAVARGVTNILGRMREFVAVLLRPFAGSGTWLLDAGKNLMLGLLRGIRHPISTVKNVLGSLKGAFVTVVAGIGGVFAGLRDKMATPVNWVIRNVINKLISGMNKIPGVNIGHVGEIGKAGAETGSDRAMAARGGKGGRGGRGWGGKAGGGKAGKRAWPANTRTLSNNYAGHSGIDIAAAGGSPIRAASAGTVEYTGWGRGYGQAIFVRGDDGLLQIYGHSSKVSTRAGARVSPGDLLGLVGSTGNSTGNHLHFEIAKSAPGTTSNRAATLAWLGGAKMGKTGPSELDKLQTRVGRVSAAGAPGDSWFDVGHVTDMLKSAALGAGKRILSAPARAAKKAASGVAGLVGIGGIPRSTVGLPASLRKMLEKRRRSRTPKARLRASRRAERKIEKKLALAKKKSTKRELRSQLRAQQRKSRLINRQVVAQQQLKAARAMPSTMTAAARQSLLGQSAGMTIGSGAKITSSFLTGQLNQKGPSQEELRNQYETAQSGLGKAGDRVAAANRQVAIASANTRVGASRIKDIDRELKGKRTEAALKKSLTTANDRVAAAQKRVNGAKTSAEKKSAKAALEAAKKNRDAIKKELAQVQKLQAEKKRLETSKEVKALAAAEKEKAAAIAAQAKAQEAATAAAEKYREAQDAAIDRATNVKNIGIGLGSIGSASFKTGGGIISNLRRSVGIVGTWGTVVKDLIAAGLRGPILEEFINEGPSAAAVFTGKSMLKSGGIGVINDLQNELNKAAVEAGALAGVDVTGAGATGGGLPGSWSSSSAPYMSATAATPSTTGGGTTAIVQYTGMPSDTVDSIADKTSHRVVTELRRAGS